MITAQELRIGNLVMLHNPKYRLVESDKIHQVLEVRENAAMVTISGSNNEYGQYYEFLKGIPLSEEILLKCGFEPIYKSDFTVKLELITEHIFEAVRSIENDWHIRYKFNVLKHFNYLHQLQNIYFALTGQELNTSGLI